MKKSRGIIYLVYTDSEEEEIVVVLLLEEDQKEYEIKLNEERDLIVKRRKKAIEEAKLGEYIKEGVSEEEISNKHKNGVITLRIPCKENKCSKTKRLA